MNLIDRLISAISDAPATSSRDSRGGYAMQVENADTPPPFIPGTTVYRSEDGTTYFRFSIAHVQDGLYRVYILEQPGYRGRRDDGHTTHRYFGDENPYICWDGRMATIGDARGVAQEWSELTLRYIRYGIRF